ncbi:MAG: hypothetical protein V9G12_20895 [Microthrixaceae bacterium]
MPSVRITAVPAPGWSTSVNVPRATSRTAGVAAVVVGDAVVGDAVVGVDAGSAGGPVVAVGATVVVGAAAAPEANVGPASVTSSSMNSVCTPKTPTATTAPTITITPATHGNHLRPVVGASSRGSIVPPLPSSHGASGGSPTWWISQGPPIRRKIETNSKLSIRRPRPLPHTSGRRRQM